MISKKVKSLVHAGLLLLSPLTATSQELPFVHYTTESARNPLPSAAVTDVHQDRLGYIWFSVYSTGLVRYDGGRMETYTASDGLRDPGVYRMVEDGGGRLWVASRNGVVASDRPLHDYGIGERVRFTTRLEHVDLPSGLIHTNAITADFEGSVWIASADAGLVRVRPNNRGTLVDAISNADLEPAGGQLGGVTAITSRSDGSVWVATLDGRLHVVGHGTLVATPVGEGLGDGSHISALSESSAGTLWAGTSAGALLRIGAPGPRAGVIQTNVGAPIEPVTDVLSAGITSIFEGPDRSLWIASEGSGVLRLDPASGNERVYTLQHGLLGPTVHQIRADNEGNLWFAQLGGISKLRFNFEAFRSYSATSRRGEQPVLPSAAVGAVAVAADQSAPCAVWAATSEGGIACIQNDGSSVYLQSDRGLRSDWVNALALDESGRLWIGTQAGIQRLDYDAPGGGRRRAGPLDASARTISLSGRATSLSGFGPSQIVVFTISTTRMRVAEEGSETVETLWFGGWDLFSLIDGRWFIFGSPAGLPRTRLHATAFDADGRLWVSTQGEGIYRSRSPVTLRSLAEWSLRPIDLPAPEGGQLTASVVDTPIFERVVVDPPGVIPAEAYRLLWAEGTLWAATADGLLALRPSGGRADEAVEVVADLGREQGLGSDFTMSLAFVPETGTLWVGTNGGLSEVDPVRRVVIRTLTTLDGLIGNEGWYTGSVGIGPNGAIYYGTARGLSVYQPSRDAPNITPPKVRLRAATFTSNGGTNEFVAEYAALGFAEEGRTRYRTRLVGYDAEWSPDQVSDRIRYTNLPAILFTRPYMLEVVASNSSGSWSTEPLRYRFLVPPPPWLQWWAIGMYVLLTGGAVVAIDRIRRSRLLSKERQRAVIREAELAAETALARTTAVEAEARALQEENRRKESELEKARELEKAYHVLKVTQAQLIQSEKLASLGQLTAGVAHEIKNPLNFVTNFATLTREVANELMERCESEPSLRLSDVREDLDMIQLNTQKIEEHGHRADGIVRSMLEHSRGGPGERQLTDVNSLVEQYVNLAFHGERARTPDFGVHIERTYDPEVGTVELVQQELGRVLLNLLDNAFYAVRQQSLALNGQYKPLVHVTTRRLERHVEIRVQDNGPGIPPDIRQKIFEPFFTTKPTGKGTGLGLSLSHNIIVQGCGGEFEVESVEGEGTTFVIRLPG